MPGERLLHPRFAARRVTAALADTPVVLVHGPRQCGKTTLVRSLVEPGRPYLTLDDETTLAAATADPTGFVRGLDRVTIDEVQRAPDLLRAIKRAVDDDRRPGRFLLTGSANILTVPQAADSLAGRMEIVTLLPLSRAEVMGGDGRFLDEALAGRIRPAAAPVVGAALVEAVLRGGYPEMLMRADPTRRAAWARDYVRAIVERDVRDVTAIEKLDRMPTLLRALGHHAGQLANFSRLAGELAIDDKTARRYVGVLEQLFLLRRSEPWSRNCLSRLVKTAKIHVLDSGLLAALVGTTPDRVAADRTLLGPLLETFVVAEILKLASWSDGAPALHHFRDKDQDEVDIVLEDATGAIVGIEVKAAATVTAADFRGLRKVAATAGDLFRLGLVLHDGDTLVPFGDRLYAAPVACLWSP